MKNKYSIFGMTLGVVLALSGCKKHDIIQEDITYSQNFHNDDQVDKSYDDIDKSEIGNDTLDNTYFLSTNHDFYEKIASNPYDQRYVINAEDIPLENRQVALNQCQLWNQQIDFTASKLERLLSKAEYDQVQNVINLWHEYYQEEVYQNSELYGINGIILGSMYTAISANVLLEKCKLTSLTLLSYENELTGGISFAENTSTSSNDCEYSLSPHSFCIEYSSDFEEILSPYSINENNCDEIEDIIHETAVKIEERFGHDYTKHSDRYLSIIQALHVIENNISEDSNRCLILKENRLKLYAIELLNILYMIENQ